MNGTWVKRWADYTGHPETDVVAWVPVENYADVSDGKGSTVLPIGYRYYLIGKFIPLVTYSVRPVTWWREGYWEEHLSYPLTPYWRDCETTGGNL